MKKTTAEIIDELGITNVKIALLIEKVMQDNHTREDAKKIQNLNKYRAELVNELNRYFKEKEVIKV